MEWIFGLDEIQSVARDLLSHSLSKLFLLDAPMGAGKTTFTAALLRELHVEEPGSSPTFSIIQEYRSIDNKIIMHMDLYRLKDEEEALQAGVQDALDRADYCFVEWPFIAECLFSEDSCVLSLDITEGNKRRLRVRTLAQVRSKLPEQS